MKSGHLVNSVFAAEVNSTLAHAGQSLHRIQSAVSPTALSEEK